MSDAENTTRYRLAQTLRASQLTLGIDLHVEKIYAIADALIAAFPTLTAACEQESIKSALTPPLQDVVHPRSASVASGSEGLTAYNVIQGLELKLRPNPPRPSADRIAELLRLGGPDGVWRDGCDVGMVAP